MSFNDSSEKEEKSSRFLMFFQIIGNIFMLLNLIII